MVVGSKGGSGAHFITNSHLYLSNYNEVRKTKGGEARPKVECVQAFISPCADLLPSP